MISNSVLLHSDRQLRDPAQIMLPAVADEKKRVVEDVAKDRQHAVDAAIVRTMKSRKVMSHQQVWLLFRPWHNIPVLCSHPAHHEVAQAHTPPAVSEVLM